MSPLLMARPTWVHDSKMPLDVQTQGHSVFKNKKHNCISARGGVHISEEFGVS